MMVGGGIGGCGCTGDEDEGEVEEVLGMLVF